LLVCVRVQVDMFEEKSSNYSAPNVAGAGATEFQSGPPARGGAKLKGAKRKSRSGEEEEEEEDAAAAEAGDQPAAKRGSLRRQESLERMEALMGTLAQEKGIAAAGDGDGKSSNKVEAAAAAASAAGSSVPVLPSLDASSTAAAAAAAAAGIDSGISGTPGPPMGPAPPGNPFALGGAGMPMTYPGMFVLPGMPQIGNAGHNPYAQYSAVRKQQNKNAARSFVI